MSEEISNEVQVEYATFSRRLMAATIDIFILTVFLTPVFAWLNKIFYSRPVHEIMEGIAMEADGPIEFGYLMQRLSEEGFWQSYFSVQGVSFAILMLITLIFWSKAAATPGKMILSCKIVDSKTGNMPSNTQFVVRYFGYIISTIPFCLGFFAIAWNDKNQGWHDKMANTVVVKLKHDFSWLRKAKNLIFKTK